MDAGTFHLLTDKNHDSKKNRFSRIKVPIKMVVGGKDFVVCNHVAKLIHSHLPEPHKDFLEKEDLDHGPFSDGTWYEENVHICHEWFQKSASIRFPQS